MTIRRWELMSIALDYLPDKLLHSLMVGALPIDTLTDQTGTKLFKVLPCRWQQSI